MENMFNTAAQNCAESDVKVFCAVHFDDSIPVCRCPRVVLLQPFRRGSVKFFGFLERDAKRRPRTSYHRRVLVVVTHRHRRGDDRDALRRGMN